MVDMILILILDEVGVILNEFGMIRDEIGIVFWRDSRVPGLDSGCLCLSLLGGRKELLVLAIL